MEVSGPGNLQGPEPIRPDRVSRSRVEAPRPAAETGDTAEISDIARLKGLLADVPDVRLEKIERLRAEIDSGAYETDEKIQTVIERLLEEL